MANIFDTIIEGLLCPDNNRIKEATVQLYEAFKQPDVLWNLCEVLTSTRAVEVRQMTAVLLDKRLSDAGVWNGLSFDQQMGVKKYLLEALVAEKVRAVKSAIGRAVGTVSRYHNEKGDQWISDVLKYTFERCVALDPNKSEPDSCTFSAIAESATTHLADEMPTVCKMFETIMVNSDAQNTLASRTVANMFNGMGYLIPFLGEYPAGAELMVKLMPLILKTVKLNALNGDGAEFTDVLAEYVPRAFHDTEAVAKLLLDASACEQIEKTIRLQCMSFISEFMRVSKTEILRQNMLLPIVRVLFELICKQPADSEDDELDGNSYAEGASHALDEIAMIVSGDQLLPLLFQLMEPAIQSTNNLTRRAAYNCMGTISEGCMEIICKQYLEIMLNVIKTGTQDPDLSVRGAAFFALGQFSENFQPDINKYSPEILTMLLEYLRQLIGDMKRGTIPITKHVDQLFYALEKCCESMDKMIDHHLPGVMDCLFKALNSPHTLTLRSYCLSALASVSGSGKLILPYFPQIVAVMQNYLVKDCDEEIGRLRIIAINTWSVYVRIVGDEVMAPYCNESMGYFLLMLSKGPDDPEVRFAIYNLLGALSNVYRENMAGYLPKIMASFYLLYHHAVFWPEARIAEIKKTLMATILIWWKMITSLKWRRQFSETTGAAFAPYLQAVFENVYKVIEHPLPSVRKACVESLSKFLTAFHRLGNETAFTEYSKIIGCKFYEMIIKDDNRTVVVNIVDDLIDLIRDFEAAAIQSQEVVKLLFKATRRLLTQSTRCQNFEGRQYNLDAAEGSRLDEMLIGYAAGLFVELGYATEPAQYAVYFDKGICILSKMLRMAIDNNCAARRTLIYETIADSIKHLNMQVVDYFDSLFNVFFNGTNDAEAKCRQHCYYGLGELLFYGDTKSPGAWPEVVKCIANAMTKETEPAVRDRICSALSRLLITNPTDFQFEEILSALLDLLPLREEFSDYDAILQAFQYAYTEQHAVLAACDASMAARRCHSKQKALSMVERINKRGEEEVPAMQTTIPEGAWNARIL
ncbi:importin-4-like [Drosophila willistoni]|uniref:importin-4-like n=1 Tax=Drosophila willistoni TaxID=7260 RepID=UPI001F073994|nr:importin-4-like [Drosophila willistoni]